MNRHSGNPALPRRYFLRTAAAALAVPGWSRMAVAQPSAWATAPRAPKPAKLVFTSWKWGNRYEFILPRFERDWGVPVDAQLSPPGPQQFDKPYALFAAGEQLDVVTELLTDRAGMLAVGMLQPVTRMPGIEEYVKDFHDFTRDSLVVKGEVWGLPYFVETWVPLYYEDKLSRAGFTRPFTSWEELVDQALKAKRDRVSEYPLLWPAGVGTEQLPGCWFGLTWNMGGAVFEPDGRAALGPGSPARRALEWWRRTFVEWKISDPRSLELRFIPALKVFHTGDYLYHLISREYYLSFANDKAQSPIAGRVRAAGLPGGRVIGAGHGYALSTASRSPEWAWILLQTVGGRDKNGQFTFPNYQLEHFMIGSGYRSVMTPQNYAEKTAKWVPKGNVEVILANYRQATSILKVVPVMLEKWYRTWIDEVNVEVQKCLRGEQSADAACDRLTAAVEAAKRKA
ncbi:MAG: extracellular solute-binding protein [Armatimonadota bacterium]|nr:extracellular solute-binding protein [Armatimonadota bacterium]MDR7487182.1 extracellular solute-binding protein [Armatimonadota bacterium]